MALQVNQQKREAGCGLKSAGPAGGGGRMGNGGGVKRQRRRQLPPALGTFGAPSAWVFLIGCTPAEPTPLPQANKFITQEQEDRRRNKGNDGNVASRTGPGDRSVNGLAERPPRDRRVVPVPGFGGSPVGEYRLWCFGLLSAGAEMCADTYRSLSQASRTRPGPMQARPRHEKPPVRKRGEASFPETKATSLEQQRVASLARG
jgi:hypothetical protein